MKRPVNTGIRYWAYLLVSLLFISTRLIASPNLTDCGYDHQGHRPYNHEDHAQAESQFNRMSSNPIDLSKNHLKVLPVFLTPSDAPPTTDQKQDAINLIQTEVLESQTFFKTQMADGGYTKNGEGKTFELVTNSSNQFYIYEKVGANTLSEYNSWASSYAGNLINYIYPDLQSDSTLQASYPSDKFIYCVVMFDVDYNGGIAKQQSQNSGICVISTQNCNSYLITHEVGHAFGLEHDWREAPSGQRYIMAYGWYGEIVFSDFARAFLNNSRFFNRDDFDGHSDDNNLAPEINITSPYSYSTGSTTHQVQFTVSDTDGLSMLVFYGKIDVADPGYQYYGKNGDTVIESFSELGATSITDSHDFGTHLSASTDVNTFYSEGSATHQGEARQVYILAIDKTGKESWKSILLYHENRAPTTHRIEAGDSLNEVLFTQAWPKDEIIFSGDSVETESIYIYKDRLTISSADPANPHQIPVPVRIEGANSIRLSSLSMPNIYVAANSINITVENCEVTNPDFYSYVGVDIGQGATVTLINTLIYDHNVGIQLGGSDLTIINCTIVDNTYEFLSPGNNSINVVNTIFAGNSVEWNVPSYSLINNSLFDRALPTNVSAENGNISGGPQFQDALNRDYRLQVGSPAIDEGDGSVSGLPTRDKVGNQRIFGNQVDIGAYEYGSSPQPVPHKLVFSSSVQTIFVGQDSGKITAQLQEQDDSPIDAVGNLVVDLASSSSTGIFAAEAGGVAITSITIADGDNEVDFYYRDTVAGNVTLTATTTIGTAQKLATQTMTVNSVTIVAISDANLRSKLESVLNKATGDEITQQELAELTELDASGLSISDLTGLQHCTNLTDLDLGSNQISNSDLSVLSSLTNLTSLSLAYNGISDLSVLSYLTNLTGLLLHGNQISNSDLSVLSSLTKLTSLSLWNNQISHIGALSNLTNLTELKLSNNPLTVSAGPTIQTLKDGGATVTHDSLLPIIPDLNLRAALESALGKTSGDSITEAELATLTALTATNRTISDLTGLEYCLNLTNLDLSGNDIVDITLLLSHSGLGSGDVIDLTGNPLTYDTYTTQIPILENKGVTVTSSTPSDAVFIPDGNLQAKLAVALGLSPNQLIPKASLSSSEFSSFSAQSSSIADLTGLEHAVNLTELSLEYNNISNIDVLSHLNQLSYLALSSNNINDISALSGHTNLDDVYLDNNQIRDIQPLVSNTGIDSDSDYVVLTGNPLSNVSFTQLIPQLESRSVIVEPAADTIGADVIDFADPKLEELIRSILNKPTELLTSTNTTGLTVLNAKNAGITDVAGLNQLTNLTSLDISFNPLSSVAVSTQIPDLQTSGVDVVHGVVRWSFEQQTGTAVSVLAQPATSGFDATPHGVPTWAPGLSGRQALKLDGVDDWVEIPNHNLINSGGPWANKTVTTVFRVDDASVVTRKQVIYGQGARTHGLNLYIHNGRLYVGGYNKEASENDWQGNWISTSVTSNTWYQAALVLRGGTDTVGEGGLELWLNGELVSTEPAAKLHGHTGGIGIGNANQSTVFHDGTGKQGTSHLFRGLINGVAIYNTALSETRLAGMTVGQLASLKAAWGPSAELPEKIIIGTETITKPIGQLTFSAINGGGSVTGITIDLSDEIMADSNDDGLDDLNTAVDPLAVTLHGYIGGNTAGDPDLTATPVDINGDKGFFFDLSSHSLSATGSQTDVPFYIELVVDPTQLNAGREKEVVQLSLSLSDIETTAVGGFRQAYDAYGQPDGHRWNDEFQPSLESPLEIEVELVKTQPLTVLPGFVQLRYQTGGTVKMYDPATEGWVTPALTLTNNTSTATTYNIHEAIRAAQPALVAVIPTDNDSANPLPSDSTDISNVKSMFAEDELTVEVNYSGDLPSKDRVVGKILLDTGRPVSSPAPKASQFGFGSNQTMDVDFVVELVRNGARVVAELTDTEDFGRID
ncbi:MAG: choice-of-anchor Q domain-containing protein, partial [Candidatus Poribacteria bacterium]|nr:choice-of-anchor Q domain-containing protein [Candidatus Poribacteria bacterium]